MESPRSAARRSQLYDLYACTFTAALVGLLVWLVFAFPSAALVSGATFIGSGLLVLLSRRSPASGLAESPAIRGALLHAHGVALLVLGGLLLHAGMSAIAYTATQPAPSALPSASIPPPASGGDFGRRSSAGAAPFGPVAERQTQWI